LESTKKGKGDYETLFFRVFVISIRSPGLGPAQAWDSSIPFLIGKGQQQPRKHERGKTRKKKGFIDRVALFRAFVIGFGFIGFQLFTGD
jgi:hypothetical protein